MVKEDRLLKSRKEYKALLDAKYRQYVKMQQKIYNTHKRLCKKEPSVCESMPLSKVRKGQLKRRKKLKAENKRKLKRHIRLLKKYGEN